MTLTDRINEKLDSLSKRIDVVAAVAFHKGAEAGLDMVLDLLKDRSLLEEGLAGQEAHA